MNKKIVHDALVLMTFALVLGGILGAVYQITKPAITQAEYEKTQAAYRAVFADAESFETIEFDKAAAEAMMSSNGYKDSIDDVQRAVAGGETVGYVITVTAKDGSQGSITLSVGIKNDGTVNGYSITSISETPGLGMKATEEAFMAQFEGKLVSDFVVVKSTPAADNEIEAIAGSTITTKAVTNACNAAIVYFQSLAGGAQ